MISLVSRTTRSESVVFQPAIGIATVSLEAIRHARGDINEIRMLLKGSVETCNNLFKQAVEEGDVVSQIQLSHALFGMKWGKDDSKDFSSLSARDLKVFSYYPRGFVLFNSAYDQAMGVESDWRLHDARGEETFRAAAAQGYLPAFLALKCNEWKSRTSSYGFAVELRPFIGKGDRQLDYYFGRALKNGCEIGSALYYEGMYWMNQSCGTPVEYPRKSESFKDFTSRYLQYESRSCHNHNGLWHVGDSLVLAPSEEAWEAFVNEKLRNVRFAPVESYSFEYNAAEILALLNQHRIGATCGTSFIASATEGRDVESLRGGTVHGFWVNSLFIYQSHKKVGTISVRGGTFKIHETFKDEAIQPVIDFIEEVITRTGSISSACSWLRQMGGRYI